MTQPQAQYLRDQLAAATADLADDPEPTTAAPAEQQQVTDRPDAEGDSEAVDGGEDRGTQARKRRKRRYDRMARIEGRVTENQLRRLDQLRGDLMKRRTRTGDRITNNTLLRVAVEGLLSCRRELRGNDEDELLASFIDYLDRARERS